MTTKTNDKTLSAEEIRAEIARLQGDLLIAEEQEGGVRWLGIVSYDADDSDSWEVVRATRDVRNGEIRFFWTPVEGRSFIFTDEDLVSGERVIDEIALYPDWGGGDELYRVRFFLSKEEAEEWAKARCVEICHATKG